MHVFPDSSRILPYEELLREVAACDILYCLLHDRVDKAVVDAGERLKLIATSAVTPSNIDVGAATSRKIPVTVVSNIVVEETADLQWGLLLAAARRIPRAEAALRNGLFPGAQSMFLTGTRVHGKTLGTIGLGAIGRSVVRRARGFAMRILYTKRTRLSPEDEVALAFRISGRLVDSNSKLGDRIEPGQLVARLESQNEQNNLRAAQATYSHPG